jgi:hypothetical protein
MVYGEKWIWNPRKTKQIQVSFDFYFVTAVLIWLMILFRLTPALVAHTLQGDLPLHLAHHSHPFHHHAAPATLIIQIEAS